MPGHTRDTRDGILYCTVTVPVIHRQSFHFDTTGKVFISTPEDTGPARACIHRCKFKPARGRPIVKNIPQI